MKVFAASVMHFIGVYSAFFVVFGLMYDSFVYWHAVNLMAVAFFSEVTR